jgi:SPP1 gp7 family putative phage head morphogenesis protein
VARKRPDYLVKVRRHEAFVGAQLRKLSNISGELIKAWVRAHPDDPLNPANVPQITEALARLEEAVGPWADSTATRMAAEVKGKEARAWMQQAGEISDEIKRELRNVPVGEWLTRLVEENARQIRSIPQEAAQRISFIVQQGLSDPQRSTVYIDEIMRSGEVSRSHATMLARTMVSSTASSMVEVRARSAGSEGYYWETMEDGAVRPEHRAMQGKFVRWDDPPTIQGYTAHAGRFANCRCHPRPVWPRLGSRAVFG